MTTPGRFENVVLPKLGPVPRSNQETAGLPLTSLDQGKALRHDNGTITKDAGLHEPFA